MTTIDSLKSQYSSKRKKLFFTFILIVISVVILVILKETSIVEWWQIGIVVMSLILIFGSQATNYISTEQNYRNALYTSNKVLKKDSASITPLHLI